MSHGSIVPIITELLVFVTATSLWKVRPTGDWAHDNRLGARYAENLIAHLRRYPNQLPLLGHIMRDMMSQGQFTGIESGFFHRLASDIALRNFVNPGLEAKPEQGSARTEGADRPDADILPTE